MKKTMALLAATISAAPCLHAVDRGTPAEAKAMLAKAVAHYKEVGRTQALADFNTKKAPFGDRDLYVVCQAPNHTIAANGAFSSYVGQSVDLMKDAEGKPLGKALWDTGLKGEGSVQYRWINPMTH